MLKPAPKKVQPNGQRPTRWYCQCDCGQMTVATTGNLKSGHTTSCGCLRCSKAEKMIEGILKKLKIPHEREYMFDDLLSEKGNPLRFDFAL